MKNNQYYLLGEYYSSSIHSSFQFQFNITEEQAKEIMSKNISAYQDEIAIVSKIHSVNKIVIKVGSECDCYVEDGECDCESYIYVQSTSGYFLTGELVDFIVMEKDID